MQKIVRSQSSPPPTEEKEKSKFLCFLAEWSSNSCISRSPSFSCCNHERIVNVLPKVYRPNSSSQSSITSWASTPRGTRISFVCLFIFFCQFVKWICMFLGVFNFSIAKVGNLSSETLTWFTYQRHYLIVNHIGSIRAEHDDFTIRFASSMNQVSSSSVLLYQNLYILIRFLLTCLHMLFSEVNCFSVHFFYAAFVVEVNR